MKNLLLTGASGFLGWNCHLFQQNNWKITGTYYRHPNGLYPGSHALPVNLLDARQIDKAINYVQPDAILHLAANSSTASCEKHPEDTRKINVEASATIAELCAKHSIPLVFTSSEQVYDGSKAMYTDEDKANPINAYGQQKAEAEMAIQQLLPEAAIARIGVLFGQQGPTSYCFMNDWLLKWKNGETVKAFHDEIRPFLSGQSAVKALFLLLNKEGKGVYNIGSADAMSRLDFARMLANVFGFENAKIQSCSQQDIPGGDKRPPSLIMDNRRIMELGFEPGKVEEELRKLL